MIPFPLIARAIVGGGLLGLLIYELAKQGKAEAKSDTSTADTTASDLVETIKEEVEELKEAAVEIAENVKDKVEEIKESLTTPTASAELNSAHLKHFKKDATKRAVKTHTTKAINKLLEEATAGTYQIVSTTDADLVAALVKDYAKKYKAEIADGKFRIESTSEKKKHFLSVIF